MSDILEYWSGNPQNQILHGELLIDQSEPNQNVLCCPEVPLHIHVIEFCLFLEEKLDQSSNLCKLDLAHLRVLKSAQPNLYTIIIKLKTKQKTRAFYTEVNNRRFN